MDSKAAQSSNPWVYGSIAGHRALNDKVIQAVQNIWKTSQPEYLGPDPDCVPVLRFLEMNLERVNAAKSAEDLPEGSILANQMEYIVEVLKFEPSLQLKTRTTPVNQESFATRPTFTAKTPTKFEQAEYLASLQALMQDGIVEMNAAQKKNPVSFAITQSRVSSIYLQLLVS